ncbi:MAG: inositol monophosphatase family protein, partial [Nakamurella sp.]
MATPNPAPDLTADLDLAAQLVTEAGKLALTMRQGLLVVDRKTSISDVVSDADTAAEAMIAERLAQLRPADGLIGEEGAARDGRRTWIVDPVDGTYNFVSGLPEWCSALALVDGDELL